VDIAWASEFEREAEKLPEDEAPKQGDSDGSGDHPCIAARSAEGFV
jgi:hypothetical protein